MPSMNVNDLENIQIYATIEKKYCDAYAKEQRVTYLQKIMRAIKMQILPALYLLFSLSMKM